jgi:hypothetical protein
MDTRRHVCTHSLCHNLRSFPTKRGLRFAAIVIIAAIVSATIAVLAFAQKPEPVLRGDAQTVQPSRVSIPRRSVPTRKRLRGNKLPADRATTCQRFVCRGCESFVTKNWSQACDLRFPRCTIPSDFFGGLNDDVRPRYK